MSPSTPRLNPFVDDVVGQPRSVSYSVPGLNERALSKLLAQFDQIASGSLPRSPPKGDQKAQLIISPDAGYGKSHLLGRLFERLGERATLIYLRPFQNTERVWSSILFATIQELERPDRSTQQTTSQIEAFATGVLAHVAADFMTSRGLDKQESIKSAIKHLRDHPLEVFAKGRSNQALLDWLRARIQSPHDLVLLTGQLSERGLRLDGKGKAWLKVLAGYALSDSHSLQRDAALCWLRGEPLEPEQVNALNLTAAEHDGHGDASAAEIDDLCRRRLEGLCMLASFYRPFVFCFDQTEFYGGHAGLVTTFGKLIEQLFNFPNNLTVVTSNANNWIVEIVPHLDRQYLDRFSVPIDLEGINQQQARQLITQRLREVGIRSDAAADFLAADWLSLVFAAGQNEIGVRLLLQQSAKRFALLENLGDPQPTSMAEAFEVEVNQIRAKPSSHQYSQDCLMWATEILVQGFDNASVKRDAGKYFFHQWSWPDRSISFAFEAGHHNARWRSLAREAIELARASKVLVAFVVFRTPDLKPVPGANWTAARDAIADAENWGLRIVRLSLDQVCELHAAREFYSNALQGNLDFRPHEVLAFLRELFTPWLKQISELSLSKAKNISIPAPAPKPVGNGSQRELSSAQVDIIINHVRERRLVEVSEVVQRLGGISTELILREVEGHPNLRAHAGPQTIVLQWRT